MWVPFNRCLLALLVAVSCAGHGPEPMSGPQRIVDLTWSFDEQTIYWPTEEGFVHEFGTAGVTTGGYYYEAHGLRAAEHGGTHLDAPIHFFENRDAVEQIPLTRLMGAGVLVDVSASSSQDPDYQVSLADLAAWEKQHGPIPDHAMVLLRTGFGSRWPDRARYLGTAKRGRGGVAELHFPGLGADAAAWLVGERKVRAVGIDTASIDHGQSTQFKTHRILAEQQVPIFENLAALETLPARDFRVIALPMKIRGGSGAPLRIIAILD